MPWLWRSRGSIQSFSNFILLQLEGKEDKESALEEYKRDMRSKINSKNLSLYMDSFHNRSDITTQLKDGLKCDALVVVGNKTSHVHAAEYMHSHMDKVNWYKYEVLQRPAAGKTGLGLGRMDVDGGVANCILS